MKELINIQSKLNAPKGQYNAFGKYKYRSCEDILAAVKPLLADNGCTLTMSDTITEVGGRIYVMAEATLTNSTGEIATTTAYAREENEKKGMDASQVTGAASSYARKYALNGLFAIDDTKDADALNTSAEYTKKTTAKTAPAPQPAPAKPAPAPAPAPANNIFEEPSPSDLFNAYAMPAIQQATSKEELARIWGDYPTLQKVPAFTNALSIKKKQILGQ